MNSFISDLFFPEEQRAAELLDRFETQVRAGADQKMIDETHDALIKLVGDLCGRIGQLQPK